jgi:hypothetical protein
MTLFDFFEIDDDDDDNDVKRELFKKTRKFSSEEIAGLDFA